MTAIIPWLKSPNLWLAAGILAAVVLIFNAGVRHEQLSNAAELSKINVPIAEQRGEDVAELAAEAKAAEKTDAVVAGAISQTCILTEQTASLLASVK